MVLSCSTIEANTTARDFCDLLNATGVGLGVFLQALVVALPYFLLIIGIIGGIVAIIFAIAGVVTRSIGSYHKK